MTRAEYLRWREVNPKVHAALFAVCDQVWAMGQPRYSARAAIHVVRFQMKADINNYLSPHFAREYLAARPDRPKFFELRAIKPDPPTSQMELGV